MNTPGEGNFKLTYYNGWKLDDAPADYHGPVGYNWSIDSFPFVTTGENDSLVFVWAPGRDGKSVWFDQSGSTYTPRFGARQTCTEDGNTWRVTDPDGTVWVFSMDDELLSKMISPGGEETTYKIEYGKITEKYRIIGGDIESRVFSYSGDQLTSVTLYRGTTLGTHFDNPVRRVLFGYYTSLVEHVGNVGDLRTVTEEVYEGSTWQTLGTRYYRYYTEVLTNPITSVQYGFVHGLRYVIGPEAYASLGGSPDGVGNTTIAGLAEKYYEYDPNKRWVTKAATNGGALIYTISSHESTLTPSVGYNVWHFKAEMTLPDMSTKTVYSNYAGRDLLVDHNSTSGRWIHYYEYDIHGHLVEHAEPSAIDMSGTSGPPYDPTEPDLDVQLHGDKGLVHVTTYYDMTTPGTGGAPGYPKEQQVRKGTSGTLVTLSLTTYTEHEVGSGGTLSKIYPVASRTVYRSDVDGVTTTYDYDDSWFSNTNQPEWIIAELPTVGSGQNGGAWLTGKTRKQKFDTLGRLVLAVDARLTETKYEYSDVTDTLAKMTQDFGTGHLNIVTEYKSDSMGRPTETIGPEFYADGGMKRTVNWTYYLDSQHEIRRGQGFYSGETFALVNPISITRFDLNGRVIDEIQATTTNTGSIPTGTISQEDWTRWTHYEYNAQGRLLYKDVYHLIPTTEFGIKGTNFNRTEFGYDSMGRRNYVMSPAETITRTVYDPRGLVLSVWVGTDDDGATPANPGGSGSPNNMRPVTINTYDEDAYGVDDDSLDGLLTKVTSPVDDTTGNDREVKYRYDWRDRQVKTITTDGTNTFEAENVYDNLSRVTTAKETRVGGSLMAEIKTFYDNWGRVYLTEQKGFDDSDNPTQILSSNTWYDAESNIIKSLPAGSEAFTKSTYDAIGRQTASYTGYWSGSTSDAPDSVDDDVIFEQTETVFDDASHVKWTGTYSRYHSALTTSLGVLVPGTTARPDYTAYYYDAIGRATAVAHYGNQADDAEEFGVPGHAPPSTAPTASSSSVLVSKTVYNDKGEAEDQVDTAGLVTRTVYDAAGRVESTTRNPTGSPQERVEMTYHADGQLKTLKAINSDTGLQVTTYYYDVDLPNSGIASKSLLSSVDYPDGGDVLYEYNRQGQRIMLTDQNGTVHEYDYDKLGRQTADRVTTVGTGVDDSVLRITWSYDNRKRLVHVTSYDDEPGGFTTCDIQFAYNDFNQLETEWQQHGSGVNISLSPKIEYGYSTGNNTIRRASCTYPNTKVLTYDYSTGSPNKLSRVSSLIWDSTDVATYDYLGLGQVVIQNYPEPSPDVEYTLAGGSSPNPYAGIDRFGRIINLQWKQSSAELVHLEYGYDLASNRKYRRDVLGNSDDYSDLYTYDDLHRLEGFERGELNGTNSALVGGASLTQSWTLDATGNWKGFVQTASGAVNTTRAHNTVNEITGITTNSGSPTWYTPPVYDNNGNMTEMPHPLNLANTGTATYDAWNRLISFDDGGGGVDQINAYDGMNRRITTNTYGTVRHFYYSDQWQVLEERLGSNTTADRQYVWGLRYIDDLVLRDTPSERLYALQDALFNIVALTNTSGAVVERFAYQPYGESEPLNPDYTAYNGTNYQWSYRFTGRELDLETGLQLNRMRYLHLQLGRWLTRDPIGYLAGMNMYQYVGSIPTRHVDPLGLRDPDEDLPYPAGAAEPTNPAYYDEWVRWKYNRRRKTPPKPKHHRSLTADEKRCISFFINCALDITDQNRLQVVLDSTVLWDWENGEYYSVAPEIWIANIALGGEATAVTLGADIYFEGGVPLSDLSANSISFIGHEFFHAWHASQLGTWGFGPLTWQGWYLADSAEVWLFGGDAYYGNFSELMAHALEHTILDIHRQHPSLCKDLDGMSESEKEAICRDFQCMYYSELRGLAEAYRPWVLPE